MPFTASSSIADLNVVRSRVIQRDLVPHHIFLELERPVWVIEKRVCIFRMIVRPRIDEECSAVGKIS
jgi:hypothetical protein